MIDAQAIRQVLEFNRGRTLATLDRIAGMGEPQSVLAWRPGPGRAHSAWQVMHLAATDDRMLNVRFKEGAPNDADLCERFAGGSTPSDVDVPTVDAIRDALQRNRKVLIDYLDATQPSDLDRMLVNDRTLRDWLLILAWHEAHHQGQAHLTLNLYEAAHPAP